MTHRAIGGSFRDPNGFVFTRDGQLYRQVNRRYRQNYDLLCNSGLYEVLVSRQLLIPHEEVELPPADPAPAYKVLRPEPLPFVSYPYEWSFSQLRDAAVLTLDIQEIALEHGMSLHDASAFNVQFRGGRPVLIDTLSFERTREGQPWTAYGQFCRHFLAPLALMAYRDPRLGRLFRLYMDGIPLDLADRLLPRRARIRPSLFLHIRAHARHHGRQRTNAAESHTFTRRAFQGLLDSLRTGVRKLPSATSTTPWSNYYTEADHYSREAFDNKRTVVAETIEQLRPRSVWDLGGNTGVFGRLAATRGIPTVCFDLDHGSVDANYLRVHEEGETNILPLLCDLTNPSPSIGWAHTERFSLAERGPADLVLALALVHHLAIGNNVPLSHIASFFRRIGHWVLVEFIPKDDPKVESMLSLRDDIFDDYDVSTFEDAFLSFFEIVQRTPLLGSTRSLYLMHARETPSPDP